MNGKISRGGVQHFDSIFPRVNLSLRCHDWTITQRSYLRFCHKGRPSRAHSTENLSHQKNHRDQKESRVMSWWCAWECVFQEKSVAGVIYLLFLVVKITTTALVVCFSAPRTLSCSHCRRPPTAIGV